MSKKNKTTINLVFKKKYFLLIILANICAFMHFNFIKEIPKFHGIVQLSPIKHSSGPLNYYSNEILDGLFDYRIIRKNSFDELSYPKLNDISWEKFEKISSQTKLNKFSSNSVTNRNIESVENDYAAIKYNLEHYININYEHFFKNVYVKRKNFIEDKLTFIRLLKDEFQIDFSNDPSMVEATIKKLFEDEIKYEILKDLFFTKIVPIEHVIQMQLTNVKFKNHKPPTSILFTIYNIIGILMIFCFLSLQLIILKFKIPLINIRFNKF